MNSQTEKIRDICRRFVPAFQWKTITDEGMDKALKLMGYRSMMEFENQVIIESSDVTCREVLRLWKCWELIQKGVNFEHGKPAQNFKTELGQKQIQEQADEDDLREV